MESWKVLLGRPLVLVAHPDDEALGCSALLQRAQSPAVIFATDGAPAVERFWAAYGSRQAYAEVRRQEAKLASRAAGNTKIFFLSDVAGNSFVDQELFKNLMAAMAALRGLAGALGTYAILTHAYEGGHPDHDACSFLGHALGKDLMLPVWEMPLYHRDQEGVTRRQQFLCGSVEEFELQPTGEELERKRRMVDEYKSQHHAIRDFPLAPERFRPQPTYDYCRPPHPETLNYEAWGWPMTGEQVSAAFGAYMRGGEALSA